MTGVEILATSEVIAAYKFSFPIYFGVIVVFMIFIAFVNYGCTSYPTISDIILGALFGVLLGAIIGLLPASCIIPAEYETHYKVIISDEVSMNDFLERYEIVDQEGKIYTVRERDGVEDDN